MTTNDRGRLPMRDKRSDVWDTEYVYRRHLQRMELLPAVGVGAAVGALAFYVMRIVLQRTPLRPERRPRVARLPEARREPR